jgi:cell division protein FtsI (penicillin-binding protein 3)
VTRGTATNLLDDNIQLAGKTGTCQLNYWTGNTTDYQSSFAGYFPADKPAYSCIVVINKPDYHIGYYGNVVAGPVFKDIADEVYSQMPQDPRTLNPGQLAIAKTGEFNLSTYDKALKGNYLPNLAGLDAREALRVLASAGLSAEIQGIGNVSSQEPAIGTPLNQCQEIKLYLR